MGCNCGNKSKSLEKEIMAMGEKDERLEAIYNHPNTAKHMHHGHSTKTRYGFIGGGRLIPGGVFKADIRARPGIYICANCRDPFVVTRTEVYCGNCSPVQLQSLQQGKPATRPQEAPPIPVLVPEPEELPPPPDLTELYAPVPDRADGRSLKIGAFSFGGKRHDFVTNILLDNGVKNAGQALDLGIEGLVKINGIGQKTAEDILNTINNDLRLKA